MYIYTYIYTLTLIGGDGDEANARARNIQDATPYPKVEKLVGTDLQPSTTVFWAALREMVNGDDDDDDDEYFYLIQPLPAYCN